MPTETERKYLVDLDAFLASGLAVNGQRLEQGYLTVGDQGFDEMRVRIKNNESAVITLKSEGDLSRTENEFPIEVEVARRMLGACVGTVLDKTRYCVEGNDGLVFEIDVYGGDLAGLAVMEVEIPSEETLVDLPSWAGEEITFDKRYKNATLAIDGRPALTRVSNNPRP